MNIVKDSLIHQVLNDGSIFGNDHDGRLGPMTTIVHNNADNINGSIVLDLGSNAGHFPIEYVRAGAYKVIAVEGRKEFETQWNGVKDSIFGIDTDRIEWNCADVLEFEPDEDYEIISCLGLCYHMEDAWSMLKRFITPSVYMVIIESQLWESSQMQPESACDNTRRLDDGVVEQLTLPAFENRLFENFSDQFFARRVQVLYHGIITDKYDGGEIIPMKGHLRGLWILTRA